MNSLRKIGPAVTNGGLTTFLSVIVLAGSQTHVFITIFKIFFLTVIFGLFHGVILLPVVLCYVGPNEKTENTTNVQEITGKTNAGFQNDVTDISYRVYGSSDSNTINRCVNMIDIM